ncbi:hypothetical protein [Novipirellula caenicola]|uniref:Uncharacterized protein n=1 Tax=Novipirellula caenicola TaxID=1536901 RepID=A0ABP9VNJ3_9BACT
MDRPTPQPDRIADGRGEEHRGGKRIVAYFIVLSMAMIALDRTAVVAQMINTSVPLQTIGSNSFENNQFGFSLQGPNFFANINPGNNPAPFAPEAVNSGVTGNVRQNLGNGVSGNLRFSFAQGSSQTFSSTTPSVTTMNGVPGSIVSQTVTPFVTGITPVVGSYPVLANPSQISGQLIQQQLWTVQQSNAQLRVDQLKESIERAERAASQGKIKMARANYLNAIRIAPEPLRSSLQQRLAAVLQQARSR